MSSEQTTTPDPAPAPWLVAFRDGMWEVTCSDGSLAGRFPREGDARTFADVAGPGPMTIVAKARLNHLRAELAGVRPVVDAARAVAVLDLPVRTPEEARKVAALVHAMTGLDGDDAPTPQPAGPAAIAAQLRAKAADEAKRMCCEGTGECGIDDCRTDQERYIALLDAAAAVESLATPSTDTTLGGDR